MSDPELIGKTIFIPEAIVTSYADDEVTVLCPYCDNTHKHLPLNLQWQEAKCENKTTLENHGYVVFDKDNLIPTTKAV